MNNKSTDKTDNDDKTVTEDDINSKITDQVRDEMLDFTNTNDAINDKSPAHSNTTKDKKKTVNIVHQRCNVPKFVDLEKDNHSIEKGNIKRGRPLANKDDTNYSNEDGNNHCGNMQH